MSNFISRQQILERIRKAPGQFQPEISETRFDNTEIYKPILPDAISCFKAELEAISGKCVVVENEAELFNCLRNELSERHINSIFCKDSIISEKLSTFNILHTNKAEDFEGMNCGITSCEYLIARTGSVLVSSSSTSGRQMIAFPPVHFIIAHSNQLVSYPEDALLAVHEKYKENLPSQITTITGPSRTADIEKTLVLGAHGPKELIVFVVE